MKLLPRTPVVLLMGLSTGLLAFQTGGFQRRFTRPAASSGGSTRTRRTRPPAIQNTSSRGRGCSTRRSAAASAGSAATIAASPDPGRATIPKPTSRFSRRSGASRASTPGATSRSSISRATPSSTFPSSTRSRSRAGPSATSRPRACATTCSKADSSWWTISTAPQTGKAS